MTRAAAPILGAAAVLWTIASTATAEEPRDTDRLSAWWRDAGVTGSVRAGYWSGSRSLDEREHHGVVALWAKAVPEFGPAVRATVEGWVRNEDLFEADATDGELREAYVEARVGAFDLRVGKQIIVWGRADRINPTDNLSPRDFTLLVPEDDDQRLGAVAAKATYHVGGLSLSAFALPAFEPHTVAVRVAPPLTVRERTPTDPVSQWAARIEQTGGRVDWSISYFDGFDLSPDLAVDRVSPAAVDLLFRYHRIRVVGADFAATLGRYGVRGEAAYTMTQDTRGDNPLVKNPFFFAVLGADRTFLEYLNVNVQYFVRVVESYRSPVEIPDAFRRVLGVQTAIAANQLDAVQHGASFRISHKWLNETLEAELAGVATFTRGDYAIRPKVTYALTDRWKVTAGADIFRGPRRSFFGALEDNSLAYVEVRWSF